MGAVFITGASRGIGRAIALRVGTNVVIAARTDRPHRVLPGTIHTVADEVEAAGGRALACVVDVRDEAQVEAAVAAAVERFGGIDALVNNAGALQLTGTLDTPMRRFDLMHAVNVRAAYLCAQKCLPHLRRATNPHILNICPPLNLDPRQIAPHVAYAISKYAMSLMVLGMAAEFEGVAVNGLWPKTTIATSAILNVVGGEPMMRRSRKPDIMADAAAAVLSKPAREFTGRLLLDEELLRAEGVTDFERYAVEPGAELQSDLFV